MEFKNGAVDFSYVQQSSQICDFDKNIPFSEYLYEEKLPVYGLFVRDACGVKLNNFTCVPRRCNNRPCFNFIDK